MGQGVRHTRELERILNLPQRDGINLGSRLAAPLTERLRKPAGTMTLKPLQALTLVEAHDYGGAFAPLPVGAGKTLISYLLPTVLKAVRPLLLAPAKHLRNKTPVEFRQLAQHWHAPVNMQFLSYEMLATRGVKELNRIAPDLVIADEAHYLKNPKAARTKAMHAYGRTSEHLKWFIPLSGTMTSRHFKEYWHLQRWALPPELHILPSSWLEVSDWGQALDSKVDWRKPLGALRALGTDLNSARKRYGELLAGTPGVITQHRQDCDASIEVTLTKRTNRTISAAVAELERTWALPDGTEFSDAPQLWARKRQMANGFWYRWPTEPPAEWLAARKAWHAFVRMKLAGSRTLTTGANVQRAYQNHPITQRWQAVRKAFDPEPEPVWITTEVVEAALRWAEKESGIIWVEHVAVGAKLAELGIPYFGAGGRCTKTGMSVLEFRGPTFAASTSALVDGFNLQRWSRNLVLNATPTGLLWEQMIGRTHRSGQEADVVTFDVPCYVDVQASDFEQALADARRTDPMAQAQKLCLATIIREGV